MRVLHHQPLVWLDDRQNHRHFALFLAGHFAAITRFNICVLRSSERHFGYKKKIHLWLNPGDYRNANLMFLLAYIIIGHPEWSGCEIEIFAAFEGREMERQVARLNELIDSGRIPISQKNVQRVQWNEENTSFETLVSEKSAGADLVITGFFLDKLTKEKGEFFKAFERVKDILFVMAGQHIVISEHRGAK